MYYSPVARQLSVGSLAKAGVRRAYRLARRIAYRPQRPGPWTHTQASTSVAGRAAREILERSVRPGWVDVSRPGDVLSALGRLPGAIERAAFPAEPAAPRQFQVFGPVLSFGPDG